MASKHLDPEQQNFVKLSLAGVDEARALLEDVLRSQIPPKDLFTEIQKNTKLLSGSKHEKLSPDQLKLCYIPAPGLPDYQHFDITLLYKLIRNLCSTLRISQGWGQTPHLTDIKIGDDVERLRIFRNERIGHAEISSVPDSVFYSKWKELEDIFKRIQVFLKSKGVSKRPVERLQFIKETDFGWQDYTKSKSHLMIERMKISDAPNISLQGDEQKVCGESACFEISFGDEDISYNWPITWKRIRGNITEQLNISAERYRGSSSQQLVITKVSKEDEGKYIATVSREENGIHKEIPSNSIYLMVTGDLPFLELKNAISEENKITIHYEVSVNDQSPVVDSVVWTKDGKSIETNTDKYSGGQLMKTTFTIHSPTSVDIGQYTCEVFNAVGSVKKSIHLNAPFVSIVEDLKATVGNPINIEATVQSCPTPISAVWQRSNRPDFDNPVVLDVQDAKYFGSKDVPNEPRLVIPKTTHDDEKYYRIVVFNRIGQGTSNSSCLKLVGDVPSLSVNHETNISERSVTLVCDVTVLDDSPEVSDVFWTMYNRKIDIAGSGGKYTGGSIADPSLTIKAVNANDKGIYQCCASNSVGNMWSEKIHLGPPTIEFDNPDFNERDERITYNATIKSIPTALSAEWLVKQDRKGDFKVINAHDPLYRGSTVALPHPRLVINKCKAKLEDSFQLEVFNFIGSSRGNTQDIDEDSADASQNKGQREATYWERIVASVTSFASMFSVFKRKEPTSKTDPLKKLYSKRGSNVLFANLSVELAESLPENKLDRLKHVIIGFHDVDLESIQEVKSVRELIIILQKKNLFTQTDVIFMQYLLKHAECEDLYDKCIQYARKQRALCFFEKSTENGFRNVKFHVEGNFEIYSQKDTQNIRKTVVAMLGCKDGDVVIDGICRAQSFFVVLAIKEIFVSKLLHLDQQHIDKLCDLKVDYFILEEKRYNIERLPKDYHRTKTKEKLHEEKSSKSVYDNFLPKTKKGQFEEEEMPISARDYHYTESKGKLQEKSTKYLYDYYPTKTKEEQLVEKELSLLRRDYHRTKTKEKRYNIESLPQDYHRTKTKEKLHEEKSSKSVYDNFLPKTKKGQFEEEEMPISARDYHYTESKGKLQEKSTKYLYDYYPTKTKEEQLVEKELSLLRRGPFQTQKYGKLKPEETSSRILHYPPLSYKDKSPATQISSINVPSVDKVGHIAVVTSDRLWVSGRHGRLLQVDSSGHVTHNILRVRPWPWLSGSHTVTEDGDLLFIQNDEKVCRLTSDGIVITLLTPNERARCIHSSRINGDILMGSNDGRMTRYDRTGRELQVIEKDDKGHSLYEFPYYITENQNGDVWTSDWSKKAVVVVDKSGRHRFDYTGLQSDFCPLGICTDVRGHVLVCDFYSHSVHLLDQDGQFLSLLLTPEQHGVRRPRALCVDDQRNLYLGQWESNTINVYKYLQDTDVKKIDK